MNRGHQSEVGAFIMAVVSLPLLIIGAVYFFVKTYIDIVKELDEFVEQDKASKVKFRT